MKRLFFILIYNIAILIIILPLLMISMLPISKRRKIVFGTTPIISNKYWSRALRELGIDSITLMSGYYLINKIDDYDIYYNDLIPHILKIRFIERIVTPFFVWLYIIRNAKVMVMPFHGVILGNSLFWRLEYFLLRINKIKTILIPYGADAYMYSRVKDPSLQNGLLLSYPKASLIEDEITRKVMFWSKYADSVITGFMGCDGMSRWDFLLFQYTQIDSKEWRCKDKYSRNNGKNGVVKIIHTPNHRGFKGTEFLIQAVGELKKEGLNIELVLLEKVPNSKVRELMLEVDILAEQFIATAYALSGIEGMASGLPVMANLDNEVYTTVFRRYSFLNECPVLSTTPETIKDNLRLLITNPKLREELGRAGRQYVEKYHSYEMAQYMFTSIFKKLDGEDIDLMNLYHPILGEYPKRKPYVQHPLVNNRFVKK